MKKLFQKETISTGLAIFSMFFGAGNLMFPLKVGLIAGQHNAWAMFGFSLTAVCLPLLGLIAMVLFDGNYYQFFNRLGKVPGAVCIFFCMLIIGPMIAMPRIVTLSHTMVAPFLNNISLIPFSLGFLLLTFLGTYKENRIINLLGLIISPLLLGSLAIIIAKGLWFAHLPTVTATSAMTLFIKSLIAGYSTLDVIGAIFFSSIIISMLKQQKGSSNHALAWMSLQAGVIGIALLALVYIGMSYLGVYYGHGLAEVNEGELFSRISFTILGGKGAIVIALAVLMACYSTIIALAAVFAEYIQKFIFHNTISYSFCLVGTLLTTLLFSHWGLSAILEFSIPFIEIGYPVLITLTLLNIGYKVWGFKPIKIPVFITLLISLVLYCL